MSFQAFSDDFTVLHGNFLLFMLNYSWEIVLSHISANTTSKPVLRRTTAVTKIHQQ